MKRMILLLVSCFLFSSAYSYDVMNRYILLEDKLKTEDMLRPFGHDFLIDINATANKNLPSFIKDVSDISKLQGSDSTKIIEAKKILSKYENTEQTLRGGVNVGVPLFSFNAFGIHFAPDFRVQAMVGTNLNIQTETLSAETISSLVGQDMPETLKSLINNSTLFTALNANVGCDIVDKALNTLGVITDPAQRTIAQQYVGKYYWPGNQGPMVYGYAKLEGKVGFLFNMTKDENWFGSVNIYALNRTDYKVKVSSATFIKNDGASDSITDQVKDKNMRTFLANDYKLGYKWDRYTVAGSIEDVKLTTLQEDKVKGGPLNYDVSPLLRLHADAKFSLSHFGVVPFLGVHKRKGYSASSGLYAGADWGTYVWADRLGLQLRTMVDKEHITLSPRMKLWFMQLEYSLKKPVTSEVDGMKVSTLHSLDFRLFF